MLYGDGGLVVLLEQPAARVRIARVWKALVMFGTALPLDDTPGRKIRHETDADRPSRLSAFGIWLLAGLVVAAAGVATALLAIEVTGIKPADLLADPSKSPLTGSTSWISIGTLANELGIAGVVLAYVHFRHPVRREVLPLGRPSARAVLGTLLAVFGMAPFADVAGELVHRVVRNDVTAGRIVMQAAQGATPATFVLLVVCVAVVPALVEETMFRGLLTAPFARHSFVQALLVPSVMFGIFHMEPTQIAGTILLGISFALARLCSGSLVPGMITHALYNAAVITAVRYAGPHPQHRIEAAPLAFGAALLALGVWALLTERARLSSQATAGNPAPPPA